MKDFASDPEPDPTVPARVAAPLRTLVYRSQATGEMAPGALTDLAAQAAARNHACGVGGVLVADRGVYLQVLEGPPAAVAELERAIRHDSRHHRIDVLADRAPARRSFAGWDMPLAMAARSGPDARGAVMHPPADLLDALHGAPERLPDLLAAARSRCPGADPLGWRPEADGRLQAHALLRALLSCGPGMTARLDGQVARAAPSACCFVRLIEDTAEALGDLWLTDRCSGAELSMALPALQGLVRRRGALGAGRPRAGRVLVAAIPGEDHVLGPILMAEVLRAAGWSVDLALLRRGMRLASAVMQARPDALVLSTSIVLPRGTARGGFAEQVEAARAARPDLSVIGAGRDLAEDPCLAGSLGLDAVCRRPSDAGRAVEDALAARAV